MRLCKLPRAEKFYCHARIHCMFGKTLDYGKQRHLYGKASRNSSRSAMCLYAWFMTALSK